MAEESKNHFHLVCGHRRPQFTSTIKQISNVQVFSPDFAESLPKGLRVFLGIFSSPNNIVTSGVNQLPASCKEITYVFIPDQHDFRFKIECSFDKISQKYNYILQMSNLTTGDSRDWNITSERSWSLLFSDNTHGMGEPYTAAMRHGHGQPRVTDARRRQVIVQTRVREVVGDGRRRARQMLCGV